MTFRELIENKDANINILADIVKSVNSIFDVAKPLKQAGFKYTSMTYGVVMAEKDGKKYGIINVTRLEDPKDAEVIVGKIAIGHWDSL